MKNLILVFLFSSSFLFPQTNQIDIVKLADEVKQEFLHAWNGYKKYAWGHDELLPLTKSYKDWYNESLLLTPMDAFGTMRIMGLDEEAKEDKDLILSQLSFDKDISVQVFEINIRLLGGLLSAYQLDGDKRFLNLAVDLANRLMPAFNSPTGMPYRYVNLKTGVTSDSISNPAEIGTLILEWGTLSKFTGNNIYYQKAKRALEEIYKRRSRIGLVGTFINVNTGEWSNTDSHISGAIDSYYEYLLKGWLMFGDKDLKNMWDESIKAINKYLADNTKNGFWYGHADMNTGKRTATLFGALDAFFPAELSLSGYTTRAEKLQASCYKMWMLEGIEPEEIDYSDMKITYPNYALRPENIESAYYLYHFTGKPEYLEMGKDYFESIVKYCRNDVGYSTLKSVITKKQGDLMHSFFLAETLKYCYLIFAPQNTIDFNKTLFNTEAHPLKIWHTDK
jgi:mannosidase alpha-like ER degradation enhancer 2